MVPAPPGNIVAETRRTVSLPATGQRIQRQVLAPLIHTQCVLPVSDMPLSFEGKIPSSHAISLRDDILFPHLVCHADALLHGEKFVRLVLKYIHSGNILIFIQRHCCSADSGRQSQLILLKKMSCHKQMMFSAPCGNLSGIILTEPQCDGMPVVMSYLRTALSFEEK